MASSFSVTGGLIEQHPVLGIVLAALVAFLLRSFYLRIQEERKISALGGHAPYRSSWVPFGLAFVFNAVKYTLQHKDIEKAGEVFEAGNPANPYTIESRTLGVRIIITADDENIKALLATQFNDFGKGETFNSEWHDFLGDSKTSIHHPLVKHGV